MFTVSYGELIACALAFGELIACALAYGEPVAFALWLMRASCMCTATYGEPVACALWLMESKMAPVACTLLYALGHCEPLALHLH